MTGYGISAKNKKNLFSYEHKMKLTNQIVCI